MTDHDAIAARVRQDRMSGTMLTGPVYIKLADMADAYLDLYDEVKRLRAEKDAKQVKRTVPAGQTPLDDKLNHRFLDVIREGEAARDAGTASPYHGHSLEHCLHATGWVSRDLRLALDEARARAEKAEAERDRLRAERMEIFGDHAHVVRGIIAAAGALPDMHDGPFKDGFLSGIEEVAARADIHAGDGGRQMLDLAGQIVDLVHGDACIVMLPAREVIEKMARAEKAEAERDRLLAALDDIAAAAFWIANEIHIGPEDEGRDIYDMALAIRDDASAALKGPEE